MPAVVLTLQKHFILTIQNGLPEAVIETNDDGTWLKCCPLCGCLHHLRNVDETEPYSPSCQVFPRLNQAQQAK